MPIAVLLAELDLKGVFEEGKWKIVWGERNVRGFPFIVARGSSPKDIIRDVKKQFAEMRRESPGLRQDLKEDAPLIVGGARKICAEIERQRMALTG